MATIREGKRPVLLVVDAQVGALDGCREADRVVGNVALAVARARERGVPVLWVQHSDADMPIDSPAWQLAPALVPATGEPRIRKRYNSSFEETPLEHELARLGATHVVLAGAQTNWCIRATAHAALERGYDLTLLEDAHTTSDLELEDGTRIPAKSMIDELNVAMKWADHPGRTAGTATARDVDFGGAS
jgi:nicotinamidase-related amidase